MFVLKKIFPAFLFLLAFVSACKTGETTPQPVSFIPKSVSVPPCDTSVKRVELSGRDVEIRDFTAISPRPVYTFTKQETMNVRVPDTRLFIRDKKLVINLNNELNREFVFPLEGAKVISGYGKRGGRLHTGIDLKTKPSDTIRAAFSGGVRMSAPYGAYGNVIVVRHANGLETVYSHNVKNLVKAGDYVLAGQPIALTGRTGRATTEHLHFETRVNGQHFDPNLLVDFQRYKLQNCSLVVTQQGKGGIVVRTKK